MDKKEVVVCAAVRKWVGDKEGVDLFINYPPGYLTRDAQIGDAGYQKGFITNKNRFVTPEEALDLTGRKSEMRFQNRDYLLPEDLY